jgi:hypothetical protein
LFWTGRPSVKKLQNIYLKDSNIAKNEVLLPRVADINAAI